VGSAKYISGTYKALGQDSRRFNGDIKNPSNNTIPSEVSNALYEMSDHLPVLMDVRMKGVNVGIGEITPNQILVSRGDNVLTVYLPQYEQVNKVWIVDITGKTVFEESVHNSKEEVGIQTSAWPSGIYMIQLSGGDGIFARQKLVID
jgi:hypothetical protein